MHLNVSSQLESDRNAARFDPLIHITGTHRFYIEKLWNIF